MFESIGSIGILAVSSIYDLKWKKVPAAILGAGIILGVFSVFFRMTENGIWKTAAEVIPAVIPGLFLLMLSVLTEKKVGAGDGIILLILGVLEGIEKVILVFCAGLFLQSLFAVGLLLAKKANKQTCIPFIPFLMAARILLYILY